MWLAGTVIRAAHTSHSDHWLARNAAHSVFGGHDGLCADRFVSSKCFKRLRLLILNRAAAAQVDKESPSSGSPMRIERPPTRRLVQAEAGVGSADIPDMDMLTVTLPILSFRPTPRSKKRSQAGAEPDVSNDVQKSLLQTTMQPLLHGTSQAALPASSASRAAEAGPADSSEEDEDWSYPALDLTASRDEAAKRLQSKAANAAANAEVEWRGDSQTSPSAFDASGSNAIAEDDAASDSSSNYERWSYPPLQPLPGHRLQPPAEDSREAANGSHDSDSSPIPDTGNALGTQPQSPEWNIAWSAPELADNPAVFQHLGREQTLSEGFATSAAAFEEPSCVMYSNAAFNCSRHSTSSQEYDGSSRAEHDNELVHDSGVADLEIAQGMLVGASSHLGSRESDNEFTAHQTLADVAEDTAAAHLKQIDPPSIFQQELDSATLNPGVHKPMPMANLILTTHTSLSQTAQPLDPTALQQQQQQHSPDHEYVYVQSAPAEGEQQQYLQSSPLFQLPDNAAQELDLMADMSDHRSTQLSSMHGPSIPSSGNGSEMSEGRKAPSARVGLKSHDNQHQNGSSKKANAPLTPVKTRQSQKANPAAGQVNGKWKLSGILGSSPVSSPVAGKPAKPLAYGRPEQANGIKALWSPRSQEKKVPDVMRSR